MSDNRSIDWANGERVGDPGKLKLMSRHGRFPGWPLTSFGSYRPGPYPHKGKGVCVRDVCAIYDNNISPSLLMILIKIIILYFIQIRQTDDSPQRVPC